MSNRPGAAEEKVAPAGPARIALDVSALQVEGFADRGIGRYVGGYAQALWRRGALAAALMSPELPPGRVLPGIHETGAAVWDGAAESARLTAGGARVVHHITAPFLFCGPGDPAGLGMAAHWAATGAPRVVLLHDLIPLRAPRHYLPSPAHHERYLLRAGWVAAADLVLANSRHTAEEAVGLLGVDPERAVSIGVGVSPYFSPPDGTDDELFDHYARQWGLSRAGCTGRPFVLTVGGSDVRKGMERAVAALGLVAARGTDVGLVVVGHLTDRWRRDLETAAASAGVTGRVALVGGVDDELLRALYRRAVVTVMPSLAEGAGLPVLESAACGTPALVSAGGALAETAATSEALFDASDTDDIAQAIEAAVADGGLRGRVLSAQGGRARESTWDAVAARAVSAIDGILAGGAGRHARRPKITEPPLRVAIVSGGSPLAAAGPSGVAVTTVGPGAGFDVALDAFGPDVRPTDFAHVVYRLGAVEEPQGPLLRMAAAGAGWIWLSGDGWQRALPASRRALAVLGRRSRGFVVESVAGSRWLTVLLGERAGELPVLVVAGPGSKASAVAAAVAAARNGQLA